MRTRLYVGNLDVEMNSAKLNELFSPFGRVVSARVKGEPGRSKSFGYVQMASEPEALAAIAGLSGRDQAGRSMIVRLAKTDAASHAEVAGASSEQMRGESTRRGEAVSSASDLNWSSDQRATNSADPSASLHRAAFEGDLSRVVSILARKATPVDARDRRGATPLHLAARCGHVEVVRALLQAGARLDATDQFGKTPLYQAVRAGRAAAATLLMDRGATVAMEGVNQRSPLHWAAYHGDTELVRRLLETGGAIDARDSGTRHAPLHYAAVAGHAEVVSCLLERGADAGAKSVAGLTAYDLAQGAGRSRAADVLRYLGGPPKATAPRDNDLKLYPHPKTS